MLERTGELSAHPLEGDKPVETRAGGVPARGAERRKGSAVLRRPTREKLQRELEAIDAAIAGHPFSSDVLVRLRTVFAESDGSGKDGQRINARLAEEGLPTIPGIWIFYARNFSSWGWLHNRRRAAVRRIERLEG
ncbi:hypothetical protein MT355_17445 [Rathayibacter sp. VKM Ac-2929]|uniref:hypothetical protein n=1 Tax=Rathayibacter sp. VKM Ac-2929 TaxID=2929480 RepID=UPI001FB3D2BA|nr:hypothetical protein [Rathayibacter sp. VKM Ac-2929]MCJ1675049.1 hypothetical protein [Rathayibacter sp. VKM Ac-2929]